MKVMRMYELLQVEAKVSSSAPLPQALPQELVKVGPLHSRIDAIDEGSVVDAETLVIAKTNAAGGMFGKRIEIVVEDGASIWPNFSEGTRKLTHDEIPAVLGCGTRAPHEALLAVPEKGKGLCCSACYEGLEQPPNFLDLAQGLPESAVTAVSWLDASYGEDSHLIGSAYVWQHESTSSPNRPSLRPL